MTNQTPEAAGTFYGLGIAPRLLEILEKLNFKTPTPIQRQAIPIAVEGKDVMGIAQTGTGKTLAFGIPMLQRIAQVKGQGLIILPTRELALQVDETFQKLGRFIGLRTAVLIGGASMDRQIKALKNRPHIIIGTPGRLNDHLMQRTLNLSGVRVLVLDEADRMLDMGFAPQIRTIIAKISKERQTMLFSATMPDSIVALAKSYMALPIRVEIARAGTAAEGVVQELYVVRKDEKRALLSTLLKEYRGSVLVFARTKHGAKKIAQDVRAMGHTAAELHSNRSLGQRKAALSGFKSGEFRVLVATDIAARGIDVKGIELVLNYDLPDNPEDYVHRIGRTGRAGMSGRAITFTMPEQRGKVRDIERLVRMALSVTKSPDLKGVALPHISAPSRELSPSGRVGEGRRFGGPRRRTGSYQRHSGGQRPRHSASSPDRPNAFTLADEQGWYVQPYGAEPSAESERRGGRGHRLHRRRR